MRRHDLLRGADISVSRSVRLGCLDVGRPTELQVMGQAVADELLFNVAVAAILFGRRSLPHALVQHQFVQVAQFAQVLDSAKGIAQWHGCVHGGIGGVRGFEL